MLWNFDNSYARLPAGFYARIDPVPVAEPRWVVLNHGLAVELGLDPQALAGDAGLALCAGNQFPPEAEPLAQAYAGHQFGHFALLGDGRAHLLGEHLTPDGRRVDIQLKGSGPTPFSRRGDGRAALGPMLREYLISEAMHGLGIPTTRSLAVVATGEPVYRDRVLPGAILTRVAASHIRVGTFEYTAYADDDRDDPPPGQPSLTEHLLDYTLWRHDPDLQGRPERAAGFLRAVMQRQAQLITDWMRVGFIHGVMNTDNMAISGETIDYGPCAFMDAYDPATVFSSIDHQGRYAFGQQPMIAHWNLARLAEALLPFLHAERAQAVAHAEAILKEFPEQFGRAWQAMLRAKLGLAQAEPDDLGLVEDLLNWMQAQQADYTNTFRDLAATLDPAAQAPLNPLFADAEFQQWLARWQARWQREPQADAQTVAARMRATTPAVIPRNHRVEAVLAAAVETGDLEPLHDYVAVLREPYSVTLDASDWRDPPAAEQRQYRTFCGT